MLQLDIKHALEIWSLLLAYRTCILFFFAPVCYSSRSIEHFIMALQKPLGDYIYFFLSRITTIFDGAVAVAYLWMVWLVLVLPHGVLRTCNFHYQMIITKLVFFFVTNLFARLFIYSFFSYVLKHFVNNFFFSGFFMFLFGLLGCRL